ncbi:MAG: hypothetical protein SOY04_04655 [Clostridium celatum]|nr:hypothetical protein [Clostridium celatum]
MADECKPVHWRLAPVEVQGNLASNVEVEEIVYTNRNIGVICVMAIYFL